MGLLLVTYISWQKDTEEEVRDIIRSNIHLQGKVSQLLFQIIFNIFRILLVVSH
jgi:hypothetical protein